LKNLKKLSVSLWLIPAILCPLLLIRGIWALTQPWGVPYQKLLGLAFFSIMWIVSLYFLFQHKLKLTAREQEKRKWLFHGIASATFVLGGIFIIIIKPDQWIQGGLAVGVFTISLVAAIRSYRKA
jgi:hypothetical protein